MGRRCVNILICNHHFDLYMQKCVKEKKTVIQICTKGFFGLGEISMGWPLIKILYEL